jgi:hypothetical protein
LYKFSSIFRAAQSNRASDSGLIPEAVLLMINNEENQQDNHQIQSTTRMKGL